MRRVLGRLEDLQKGDHIIGRMEAAEDADEPIYVSEKFTEPILQKTGGKARTPSWSSVSSMS
jgi:hypothetical protein